MTRDIQEFAAELSNEISIDRVKNQINTNYAHQANRPTFGKPVFPMETDVMKALKELSKYFELDRKSTERVQEFLENDKSLLDDLPHLIIAASLVLSDASQMTDGGLRAYKMGDKILIEEKTDDSWNVVRTMGRGIAERLAYARAKKRIDAMEEALDEVTESPSSNVGVSESGLSVHERYQYNAATLSSGAGGGTQLRELTVTPNLEEKHRYED